MSLSRNASAATSTIDASLKRKRIRIWPLAVIGLLTAVCLMTLLGIDRGPRFTQVTGDGVVAVETYHLRPGSAEFYSYSDRAGKELRFFLARSVETVYKTRTETVYESSAVPKSTGKSVNHATKTFVVRISGFYLVKTVLPCVSPFDIAPKASFARSVGRT